jgi:putative flippase GtrA
VGRPKHTGPRWSAAHYAGRVANNTDRPEERTGIKRVERALLFAFPSVIGLGVVCIVIVIVASISGHGNSSGGIWPAITLLPEIAFPIAIILVIAYVIVSVIRRARETRDEKR